MIVQEVIEALSGILLLSYALSAISKVQKFTNDLHTTIACNSNVVTTVKTHYSLEAAAKLFLISLEESLGLAS